jgi:hypothetical protein
VDDAQAPARLLQQLHGRERGVVAADGDELRDVEPEQGEDGVLQELVSVVGLAREIPICDPPRKWMRLTSSMSSGVTWSMSPCMIHSNPSRMPSTGTPSRTLRMVAAPMTLLIPGAGTAAHEDGELALGVHGRRPRDVVAAFFVVFLAVFITAFFCVFAFSRRAATPPSSFATVRRGAINR